MNPTRRALLATAAALPWAGAHAQAFPARPLTMLVPSTAGGAIDFDNGPLRLSLDLAYQRVKVRGLRHKVALGFGVNAIPAVPKADANYSQPWTYTEMRDVFGILKAEYDIADNAMVYASFGARDGMEDGIYGGITVLNDLTAREIQKQEVVSGTKFWVSKNMPGFCPVGPYAVPLGDVADPYDLWLTCEVNGQQRLRVSTDEYIHRIEGIIAHFTRFMAFESGDIIATGAPRGTAIGHPNAAELYLKPGDTCVAGLEGLMQLTTRIVNPNEA